MDVARDLPRQARRLNDGDRQVLITACEAALVRISPVARCTLLESEPGQVVHKQGQD
jgi:hypothetical protein